MRHATEILWRCVWALVAFACGAQLGLALVAPEMGTWAAVVLCVEDEAEQGSWCAAVDEVLPVTPVVGDVPARAVRGDTMQRHAASPQGQE